jgi:protein Mpv17
MLARVALDQLVFAPVGIAVFFSTMAVLEGGDPKKKLHESWWTALRANWNIWPAVQVVNFRFVPLDLRVLFANVISIG